jgi:hypothetical protein
MKWHHFPQCPWKIGTLQPIGQWRNKQKFTRVNPWSHHLVEIISSNPMMLMDTCLTIFEHTLDIFNECCTFPHLTGCHTWSLELQCWAIPKLVTSGKHRWLALLVTEHLTDTETGNILRPHTQIHPQCDLVPWTFSILVSVNVWVSSSKVLFSSSNF